MKKWNLTKYIVRFQYSLNQSLTWKLHKYTTENNLILPDNWNEIHVIVSSLKSSGVAFEFNAINDISDALYLNSGFYENANSHAHVRIVIRKTYLQVSPFLINGVSHLNSMGITVYYR